MSTLENSTITLEQLQVLEQKAKIALTNLKHSFQSAIEYVEEIENDFKNNAHINETERPMYLDVDSELRYLVHDYSNLENPSSSWSQNTAITGWLEDINNYRAALKSYLDQYNQTH